MARNVFLTGCIFISLVFASPSSGGDKDVGYRGIPWGSTQGRFKLGFPETTSWDQGDGMLAAEMKIVSRDAILAGSFVDGKLTSVSVIFREKFSNNNSYLGSYQAVKDLLNQKYGASELKASWSNDLYSSDASHYGFAVSIGHLALSNSWETGETSIDMILSGNNYKITHAVRYASKALKGMADRSSKEKSLGDL